MFRPEHVRFAPINSFLDFKKRIAHTLNRLHICASFCGHALFTYTFKIHFYTTRFYYKYYFHTVEMSIIVFNVKKGFYLTCLKKRVKRVYENIGVR